KSANPGDPEPASAWLLNSIANKHADALDNYPLPTVLPREETDKPDAQILTSVLPTVLEQNGYEQTYSDMWWYKLKMGTGVTGVFWDSEKQNGLGDIDIRDVDILNLFWEPGITEIQKSSNLFHVDLFERAALEARYPEMRGKLSGATIDIKRYIYDDTVDVSGKVAVVDWYYKLRDNARTVLHYCKFCAGQVLYASENDPAYAQRGFYDHGRYPFIFDTLFPEAGTPAGFGYLDICKSPQLYIDKLDQVVLKHAIMSARQRFFVRGDGQINENEFADWSKDFVHFLGSGNPNDSILPINIPDLSASIVNIKQLKIEELKETSGNRDFSQGSTMSGVTAASAIAALQEAGSKLSRDMIKSSYRATADVGYLCIDLMRQFYTEPRMFRIVGKQGEMEFAQLSGQRISEQRTGDAFAEGFRVPYFDIRIVAQKASPFSTVAQNERAKELYQMGFFRPDMSDQALAALSMMQFDGIESVREKIGQNGTMFETMQQMSPLMVAMAQQLDAVQGTQYTQQVAQMLGIKLGGLTQSPKESGGGGQEAQTNALGDTLNGARKTTAGEARKSAAANGAPK
ncbi:MAG: hypothetical protein RR367_09800, partial [Clostridia bacterium]